MFFVALLAMIGVASPLQFSATGKHNASTYWMRLQNMGDVQYSGLMRIGGQQFRAIVDTGSWELLVFGVNCSTCGSRQYLYDGSKSPDYLNSGFQGAHNFGSGSTFDVEVADKVQIGALHIPRQVFWEVVSAEMPILTLNSFQVILGVGPPASIVDYAEKEADDIHQQMKKLRKKHSKVTAKAEDVVDHYDQKVTHAKNTSSVIENLRVENMAICLNKESGSHGYFIWNDRRVLDMPDKFTEVNVTGDVYWSLNLTNVKFDAVPNGEGTKKKKAKGVDIGCGNETCSAVIDTGTSLITAPTKMAEKVFEVVHEWLEAGGSCDDLSGLPDLEFRMNGKPFSLPPEAYVGTLQGEPHEDLKGFMPHLYQKKGSLIKLGACQPLLMTMDAESQHGPMWVLGLPLFRKYYTNFHFVNHIGKLSVPQASTMSFAVADSKCRPSHSLEQTLFETRSTQRKAQLHVDASQLRVSFLAQHIHAKGESLLAKPRVRI